MSANQTNTDEYKEEGISVTLTRAPGCQIEMAVRLEVGPCEEAYAEAVRRIRKQVNLPGFRKGKAPLDLVKKNYTAAIDEEWQDVVLTQALQRGMAITAVFPWSNETIGKPQVDLMSREEGAHVTFQFECFPDVPALNREEIAVPQIDKQPVTQENIDKRVDDYRAYHSKFEEWLEREIEEGDFVRMDIENIDEDPPTKLIDDRQVELKAGMTPPWLIQAVLKKKGGDQVETTSELDPDADEETKKAFKPTKCRITIRRVERQVPPEDTELANAMNAGSMEELINETKKSMEAEEERQYEQKKREQLWKALFDQHPFELPQSLVTDEHKRVLGVIVATMRQQNQQDQIAQQRDELESRALQEAHANLHRYFLANKVVQSEGLEPTDKEVKDHANYLMLMDAYMKGQKPSPDPNKWKEFKNQAFYQLTISKAEDHLLSR